MAKLFCHFHTLIPFGNRLHFNGSGWTPEYINQQLKGNQFTSAKDLPLCGTMWIFFNLTFDPF